MNSKPMLVLVLLLVGFVLGVVVYGTHKPVTVADKAQPVGAGQAKSSTAKPQALPALPTTPGGPLSSASASATAGSVASTPSAPASLPMPASEISNPVGVPVDPSRSPSGAQPVMPAAQDRKPLIPGPDDSIGDPILPVDPTKK